jgi:hypothetical protein
MIDLFVGQNTHVIELSDLRLQPQDRLVDDASVRATLTDLTGDVPTNVPDPITMPAVEGESGKYRGTIPADADLTNGEYYVVTVTAVDGSTSLEKEATVEADVRDEPT